VIGVYAATARPAVRPGGGVLLVSSPRTRR
jgi:hypothetical protein